MNLIRVIFSKELKETLRDKRTIVVMLLVPLMIYPLLLGVGSRIVASQNKKAAEKVLKIGLIDNGNAADFGKIIRHTDKMEVITDVSGDTATIRQQLEDEEIDAVFIVDANFDANIDSMIPARISMFYDPTNDDVPERRLLEVKDNFEKLLTNTRYDRLNVSEDRLNPLEFVEVAMIPERAIAGMVVGGILPYFFIMFCLMGCMYPAIDLISGEKERGTIETLLASPASRFQILAGKFGVVALSGIISACVAMIGLYASLQVIEGLPSQLLDSVLSILEPKSIILLITLLLPLTVLLASLLITMSIYSNSFKEAQSKIQPMLILVVLPAMAGFLPGVELNMVTSIIPLLNVTLAAKAVVAGNADTLPLVMVYVSQVVFALIGIYFSTREYKKEGNVVKV